MFILTRLRTLVRLKPSEWSDSSEGKPLPETLKISLNLRLSNKILNGVGLVIGVYDILEIGDSYILPSDEEGAAHTRVVFRAAVFRPFVEEVLVGRIKSCTPTGVNVSLGFFDDILIPFSALQHPHRFDENEQVWVWEYPTGDEDNGHHDLFMDPGEEIRFRITEEIFTDTSPNEKPSSSKNERSKTPGTSKEGQPGVTDIDLDNEEKKIPMQLIGSANEPGLGLLSWWNNS